MLCVTTVHLKAGVDEKYLDESYTGVRMSQGQLVTADGSLGGRIVWVKLSRGQFIGGRIV